MAQQNVQVDMYALPHSDHHARLCCMSLFDALTNTFLLQSDFLDVQAEVSLWDFTVSGLYIVSVVSFRSAVTADWNREHHELWTSWSLTGIYYNYC